MLKSLQMGRGLAAMSVAAFHLSEACGMFIGTPVFEAITDRGHLGVDFFFVLSGFIILQAHESDIGRPDLLRKYLVKRAIRIYPVYWLYTSAAVVAMVIIGSKNFTLNAPADWLTTYTLVRFSGVVTPLHQGWTLFHELAFYIIFASLILSARWGSMVMAAWAISIAALHFYPAHERPNFIGSLFGAYNLNFMLGMAAYLWTKRAGLRGAWFAFALGLLVLGTNLTMDKMAFDFAVQKSTYGAGFALLIAGAAALELRGRWQSVPLLEVLGDASYSIYLLHEHVENYSLRAFAKLGLDRMIPHELIFLIVLAITAWAGYWAYRLVEQPMLNVLRRRLVIGRMNASV